MRGSLGWPGIVERLRALSDEEVAAEFADVHRRFDARHRNSTRCCGATASVPPT